MILVVYVDKLRVEIFDVHNFIGSGRIWNAALHYPFFFGFIVLLKLGSLMDAQPS